jgi:D-3-phosphoglycerate dehydrogenase
MARKRVIITETIHEDGMRLFERADGVEVVLIEGASPRITLDQVLRGAHGIMVRVARLDRRMIGDAPSLQVITKHGVGYDNIDVAAATEKGIPVTFTPGANAQSVAEHAVGLMLALSKKLCSSHAALKTGALKKKEDFTGLELWKKTLGIVGLGRIGRELAYKCSRGFGMRVAAFDPYVSYDSFELVGIELVKRLGDLLKMSDFVTINCPLTPKTRGLIGEKALRAMKRTAFVVNTSRGGIINEDALHKALTQGWIAGAGLDVFVDEPPTPENPLLRLDNVVATPHTGGVTEEAMSRMATMAADDILRVLAGERPRHVVNPEIYG